MCVFSLGLPPSLFPISLCWDCSQPITARLRLTPDSPGLTLLCWVTPWGCSLLCDVQQQTLVFGVFFVLLRYFPSGWLRNFVQNSYANEKVMHFLFSPGRREVPLPSFPACTGEKVFPSNHCHVSLCSCCVARENARVGKERWRVEVRFWNRPPCETPIWRALLNRAAQQWTSEASSWCFHTTWLFLDRVIVSEVNPSLKLLAPRLSPPWMLEMPKFSVLNKRFTWY